MRTLVTLVLACFLAQLSIVSTGKAPIPECGTTFKCFTLDTCKTGDASAGIAAASIEEVFARDAVTEDCSAVVRFHAFTPNWMYVSIESFNSAENSIKFNYASNDGDFSSFECDIANGKAKGGYRGSSGVLEGDMIESLSTITPLKCTFILKKNSKVNTLTGDVQFILGVKKSAETSISAIVLNFDPATVFKFKPLDNPNPDEKYTAVEYSHSRPGKYECKGNTFKRMEFKSEDSDTFEEVKLLKCDGAKLLITVTRLTEPIKILSGFVNIRCVAEAQYFCDYSVNSVVPSGDSTVLQLEQKAANPAIPEKGTMECPATHPIIFVNGKPIMNDEKIKCQHQNGLSQWIVNGVRLKKNAAEVHCANEIKCEILGKIPASTIKKGKLIDNIPTCRENGTMKVQENDNIVSKVYCNKKTGKYMYKTGNQDIEVGNTTFICKYKAIINHEKDKEKKREAYTFGAISGVGVFIGGIILIILCCCAISWIRMRLLIRKLKKRDEKESRMYGMKKEKFPELTTTESSSANKSSAKSRKKTTRNISEVCPIHLSASQTSKNIFWDGEVMKKMAKQSPLVGTMTSDFLLAHDTIPFKKHKQNMKLAASNVFTAIKAFKMDEKLAKSMKKMAIDNRHAHLRKGHIKISSKKKSKMSKSSSED